MNTLLCPLRPVLVALSLLSFTAISAPASAQSVEELVEAFAADWFITDSRFSTDEKPCRIVLESAAAPGDDTAWRSAEVTPNCAAPLAPKTTWKIESGKIILRGPDGTRLGEPGGAPSRLTGAYVGTPDAIILERTQGGGPRLRWYRRSHGTGVIILATAITAPMRMGRGRRFFQTGVPRFRFWSR